MNSLQANDAMFARLQSAWNAGASAIVGYVPPINWPMVVTNSAYPADKPYLGVSTLTQTRKRTNVGQPAKYEARGLLYAEVNGPAPIKTAGHDGRKLAELLKTAFDNKSETGGLWYNAVLIRELPTALNRYRLRVEVSFRYMELSV